jgi:hypothetical protein
MPYTAIPRLVEKLSAKVLTGARVSMVTYAT